MKRLVLTTAWPSLLLLTLISLIHRSVCVSQAKLIDFGYTDLVVAITEAIPKNQSDVIIKNIKKLITEASPILYKATDDRAYFRSVQILIPETWIHIPSSFSTWETINEADVIIDAPNSMHQDIPYTRQNGLCGDPGEYIHFTPTYIATIDQESNVKKFGKPGKVFVHEWAHLRYGVFDEYGTAGDPNYPLFYLPPQSQSIQPNVCANKPIKYRIIDISNNSPNCKIDPITKIYDKNCRFVFDDDFKPTSSLSSYHQLDSIVHFCRDDQDLRHKHELPNRHNQMCSGRSAWSVIMDHSDFAFGKSAKGDLDDLPIDFQIVRAGQPPKFVVVTDVSLSMANFSRIDKLAETARAWIKNDLPPGSKLGMVSFSSDAAVLSGLKVITDMKSRQEMMDKVPKKLIGATCIGCGLELATKLLVNDGKGGIIVLITDGKNSPGRTTIADAEPQLIDAKIRVVTIGFGKDVDKNIERLADVTGGKSYFISDENTNSEAIRDAFLGALTYQTTILNNDLEIKLFESQIKEGTKIEFNVDVDPTVGRNLKLKVSNLDSIQIIKTIEMFGPSNQGADSPDYDSVAKSVSRTVSHANNGLWTFVVEADESPTGPLIVTVTTQLKNQTEATITTKCWIPNGANIPDPNTNPIRILAQVWKGSSPVIHAPVKAFVIKPNDEVEIIDLLDDGGMADTTANDGVYSRYFTNVTQNGRYSVKCQVINKGTALAINGFIGSPNPHISESIELIDDQIHLENFSRIASGGSFKVDIPVPMGDAYPPGGIRDLSVVMVHRNSNIVSIQMQWTAPGDELDYGIVSKYELKYSDDPLNLFPLKLDSLLISNSVWFGSIDDDVMADPIVPVQAGSLQTAMITLVGVPLGQPCYVALRAVDKASKVGPVSNIASFFVDSNQRQTENNQEAAHTISIIVAGLGLLLIVAFAIACVLSVVRGIEIRKYSFLAAKNKSPI